MSLEFIEDPQAQVLGLRQVYCVGARPSCVLPLNFFLIKVTSLCFHKYHPKKDWSTEVCTFIHSWYEKTALASVQVFILNLLPNPFDTAVLQLKDSGQNCKTHNIVMLWFKVDSETEQQSRMFVVKQLWRSGQWSGRVTVSRWVTGGSVSEQVSRAQVVAGVLRGLQTWWMNADQDCWHCQQPWQESVWHRRRMSPGSTEKNPPQELQQKLSGQDST